MWSLRMTMDLPAGVLRLRPGAAAGQKGVGSIDRTAGYTGICAHALGDRPSTRPDGDQGLCLEDFLPGEKIEIDVVIQRAVDALGVFVMEGLDKAMNQFNVGVKGE